jgi:hypothetical protein
LFDGTYFVDANDSQLVLNMNKDGTGTLHSIKNTYALGINVPNLAVDKDIAFKWIKKSNKVQLTFAAPINYGKKDGTCTYPNNSQVCEQLDVLLNSITLSLLGENDVNILVGMTKNITTKSPAGVTGIIDDTTYANINKPSAFNPISTNDLLNKEWYTNERSYVFNADLTVKKTNLITGEVKVLPWKLENNRIMIDSGATEIWVTYKHEAGFGFKELQSTSVDKKLMIQRMPVTMSKADWVGRWLTHNSLLSQNGIYDFLSDGKFRDGFDVDLSSAWSVLNPTTTMSLETGFYNWSSKRDVIAIVGSHYYFSQCGGHENDITKLTYCTIDMATIEKSFAGIDLWSEWSLAVFEDQEDSIWRFFYGTINTQKTGVTTSATYRKISSNKYYLAKTDQVIELISSSKTGVQVCMYSALEDCTLGKKYILTRGLDIGVTHKTMGGNFALKVTSGDGGWSSYYIESAVTIPRNSSSEFLLYPDTGYKIDTVSGCSGTLVGNAYTIPARNTTCEISVSFAPL